MESFGTEHVEAAARLWQQGYDRLQETPRLLSSAWRSTPDLLRAFLTGIAQRGTGVVAVAGGDPVGYMVAEEFDFHGERCAFVPILAHAARYEHFEQTYHAMYVELSKRLVQRGTYVHLATFFSEITHLEALLYDYGFGAYVIDAMRPLHGSDDRTIPRATPTENRRSGVTLRRAARDDAGDLAHLDGHAGEYLRSAPIFVDNGSHDDLCYYQALLEDEHCAVFMAYAETRPVGFFNIRFQSDLDSIQLTDERCGLLDPLGAYVEPEYRRQGVGLALLAKCVAWACDQGLARLHVDFETANRLGKRFWLHRFTPYLTSVRRKINADARA